MLTRKKRLYNHLYSLAVFLQPLRHPGKGWQPHRRLEVPNGVNPGKGVTVAANPAARDDAYAKLKKYLREHLGF